MIASSLSWNANGDDEIDTVRMREAATAMRAMSYDKFPDRLSRPMSRGQAATLEADRRIEALRQEIALANSF